MVNTDESGGTRYSDGKPAGWWYAPILGLRLVAKVWEMGAEKYAPKDWAVGQSFSTLLDCAMRHTLEVMHRGPWARDPESGQYHAAHVAWNWLTLLTFMELERHDLDDCTKWDGVTAKDKARIDNEGLFDIAPEECFDPLLNLGQEAVNRPQEGDEDFVGPTIPPDLLREREWVRGYKEFAARMQALAKTCVPTAVGWSGEKDPLDWVHTDGRRCCGKAPDSGPAYQCPDCPMHSIELRVIRSRLELDRAP